MTQTFQRQSGESQKISPKNSFQAAFEAVPLGENNFYSLRELSELYVLLGASWLGLSTVAIAITWHCPIEGMKEGMKAVWEGMDERAEGREHRTWICHLLKTHVWWTWNNYFHNVNLHQSPIKMSGCSRSDFLLWILNTSESIVGLRQALIVDWPNDWSLGFLVNSMRLVIHSAGGSSGKPIFTYSVHICLYLQISKIAYLPTVY